MKLDSRSLLVLLDGIQKGTVTIQMDEDGGITVEDAKAPQKKGKQHRSSQTTCWSDDRKRGFRR